MKKCFLFLFLFLFLGTSAQAYSINFDSTGSGEDANLEIMDEWELNEVAKLNEDADQYGDIFTYQDASTGEFTESFTLRVTEGTDSSDGELFGFPPFYADINFQGQYFADDDIRFYDGAVTMYDDNNNNRAYDDGTDTLIADLIFTDALIGQLNGSLLGQNGLQLDVEAEFLFDYVNPNFWGPEEEDLVDKSWLIAFVGNEFAQENIWGLDSDGQIVDAESSDAEQLLIEWDHQGSRAEFKAVPEPTTLLLFGTGLLGLAAFGRKKFMNKN